MGLSTTYTKVETDYKLQELQKFIASGLKGTLKITDAAPTGQGLYILSDIGTYTNLGGLVTTTGKINYAYFDGTTWSLISVEVEVLENFAETQNLVTTGTIIYNYATDGVLTSYSNESVGINPKKGGSSCSCCSRNRSCGCSCCSRNWSCDCAYRDWETDRKSTRLNSSHSAKARMPSSA